MLDTGLKIVVHLDVLLMSIGMYDELSWNVCCIYIEIIAPLSEDVILTTKYYDLLIWNVYYMLHIKE